MAHNSEARLEEGSGKPRKPQTHSQEEPSIEEGSGKLTKTQTHSHQTVGMQDADDNESRHNAHRTTRRVHTWAQ